MSGTTGSPQRFVHTRKLDQVKDDTWNTFGVEGPGRHTGLETMKATRKPRDYDRGSVHGVHVADLQTLFSKPLADIRAFLKALAACPEDQLLQILEELQRYFPEDADLASADGSTEELRERAVLFYLCKFDSMYIHMYSLHQLQHQILEVANRTPTYYMDVKVKAVQVIRKFLFGADPSILTDCSI